jgi:hypothetical protein
MSFARHLADLRIGIRIGVGFALVMAQSEPKGNGCLFFRQADFNTYGVLNVREEFAASHPELVAGVIGSDIDVAKSVDALLDAKFTKP